MIVEILVNAINREHSDPIINARGCWKKGYPVVCKEQGWNWGSMEGPPVFSMVRVIDAPDLASIQSYVTSWTRETTYDVLSHNPNDDFFQVRIYATPESIGINTSGNVTAAEMGTFLTSWGAKSITDASGVVFTITAMDALNATGYINYGDQEDNVIFTEVSYDATNGVHTIIVDYSKSNLSLKDITYPLSMVQCSILSTDEYNKKVTFNALRNDMIGYLEMQVERNFNIMLARAQHYFPESVVDKIVVDMTFAQLQSTMIDIRQV